MRISDWSSDVCSSDLLCMVYGFSGDVMIARDRAKQNKQAFDINYFIPQGGAPAWFDVMAGPKDAPHAEHAIKFINYFETPQGHAAIKIGRAFCRERGCHDGLIMVAPHPFTKKR